MAVYTAIDDSEAYFQAKLYTGDGEDSLAITLDGDTDMQSDLIWIKNRSEAQDHAVFDSVRGKSGAVYYKLRANATTAEDADADGMSTIGSDGFTVKSNDQVNGDGDSMVAWCWKESATAGFDMVAYTGNGTDDTDISHNLSAVPKMIIVKNRDAADAWQVYFEKNNKTDPETDYFVFNTNAADSDAADRWSDEAPTSSVFTLGDADEVNTNTEKYIAYCFADVQGFSKFGKYTGNGNADGTFVYTGFRPAWVLIKRINSAQSWVCFDNKRPGYNLTDNIIFTYLANAEQVDTVPNVDLLSNGIKMRHTDDSINGAEPYIYMAFAEAPFVNSNGVPCNAR